MAVVYAPEDPTLPKPWKGLLDGATGTIYYWNQETNVTQYERPADNSTIDDDERYNRGSTGVSRIDSGAGTHQVLILSLAASLFFYVFSTRTRFLSNVPFSTLPLLNSTRRP